MRRALLAVIAAGTLLTGAACDSDANGSDTAAAPAPSRRRVGMAVPPGALSLRARVRRAPSPAQAPRRRSVGKQRDPGQARAKTFAAR